MSTHPCILLAVCAACAAMPAWGQAVERPLRIIVAAEPDTVTDEQIRALAPAMGAALRRTLLLDNRGQDRGIPASEAAARGEPNGNTLLLGSSLTHAANPALHRRLSYDPVRDFVAVTQLSHTGTIVAGAARLPVHDVGALVRHADAQSRPLSIAVEDALEQMAGAAFGRHTGMPLTPVRLASSLEIMTRLRRADVDLALLTPFIARPHVHAGRIKAFAITGADRSPALPEVATLVEQGIEGFDIPSWDGLFAPAGTPATIVEAFHRAARHALNTPGVRNLYRELGIVPVGSTPEAFAAVVKRDLAVYRGFAAQEAAARK